MKNCSFYNCSYANFLQHNGTISYEKEEEVSVFLNIIWFSFQRPNPFALILIIISECYDWITIYVCTYIIIIIAVV